MKQLLLRLGVFISLCYYTPHASTRSIHRPTGLKHPKLITQWTDGTEQHEISSPCLEKKPLFSTFDEKFFMRNLLPEGHISYRQEPEKSVTGSKLAEKVEQLLKEVELGRKKFTHFSIIATSDFNRKAKTGLLILKFKHHPFVLKLFIENPASFTRPHSKGFEQMGIFYLGGGVNRHLLGFTRIKNALTIRKIIKKSPTWSARIDVPRKWFWQPKQSRWLKLTGLNFGKKNIEKKLPAIYGIVADEIKMKRKFSFFSQADRKLGMKISNALKSRVDPNISNFIIEKKTNKAVIIDTEHFPILAGLKESQTFTSYFAWYTKLAFKFVRDILFRTKKERYPSMDT